MTVAPLEPQDPEQVDHYRLLGRLGAGGMGQVYLARSPGSRQVAVKLIHAELAADLVSGCDSGSRSTDSIRSEISQPY